MKGPFSTLMVCPLSELRGHLFTSHLCQEKRINHQEQQQQTKQEQSLATTFLFLKRMLNKGRKELYFYVSLGD